MLELWQFGEAWGLPNISPFCIKTETYLKMAQVPFKICIQNNPNKSPNGRLPYIKDGGTIITDSSSIIEYTKTKFGDPLDSKLTVGEKNDLVVYQHLFEDSLYWVTVYGRWFTNEGWEVYAPTIAKLFPPGLGFLKAIVRRDMLKQMDYQGISQRSADEVFSIGRKNLQAASAFLGEKPYFLGNKMSSLDASAYGALISIMWAPFENRLKQDAKSFPNLEKYCQRIKSAFYTNAQKEGQKLDSRHVTAC